MQTAFSLAQLADPAMASSEKILRTCVHCGFCTATCPTYLLLGDELDSPRGRIYLIKDMLEGGKPASTEVVKHIDRCLSCLSCMTTCPSGRPLHAPRRPRARAYIEKTYRRPSDDRLVRELLARRAALPAPLPPRAPRRAARRSRSPLLAGRLPRVGNRLARHAGARARPAAGALAVRGAGPCSRPKARARAAWRSCPAAPSRCCGPASTRRRSAFSPGTGSRWCCRRARAAAARSSTTWGARGRRTRFAKRNIDAWIAEIDGEGLDAIVVTASGCGTTIKDYGHMFRADPAYAEKAATGVGDRQGRDGIPGAPRALPRGDARRISSSPITPPARCSTASASRTSRSRSSRRPASR